MEIHLDPFGRQWSIGNSTHTASVVPTTDARWVILPLLVEPMYLAEAPEAETIYSHCAICGTHTTDYGFIVLEFVESAWGVRIGCADCAEDGISAFCKTNIANVSTILTPIITNGHTTPFLGCIVCDRNWRCNDPRCREIIKSGILKTNSPIDDLLEHFYRIRLDVISPLVLSKECAFCKSPGGRLCRICRLVTYCNYGCKIKSAKCARCTSFIEIWRSAQRIFSPTV